ncbi:amidohydrolase family protein [Streptomyces sp. NPDC050560]|uniref:amidohydrolase family protein n=1 Tax=Streptomyces sp. NPDC050560 TaxID=3365630 RepID=UPI0037BCF675
MSAEPWIIDAHHHVWDLAVRDQPWISGPATAPLRRSFTLADLAADTAGAGIAATVLVQTVTVAAETPEFLALADGPGPVAKVVGWTDLTRPDVAEALAALGACRGGRHLAGIRHQVQEENDPGWLQRPDVARGLAAVAAAGLVYDLVVLPHQLPACVRAAAAQPGLTFVLDHLGKPPIASGSLEPWAGWVRELAALPNTVCKLSGMVTEADPAAWTVEALRPYAETVLDAFGPARVMFGSDWPVCTLAAPYTRVLDVALALTDRLAPAEREAVFAGTAARVYGVGAPDGAPSSRVGAR